MEALIPLSVLEEAVYGRADLLRERAPDRDAFSVDELTASVSRSGLPLACPLAARTSAGRPCAHR